MIIPASASGPSMSTEEFLSCFEHAPNPALSLRLARMRRTCQVAMKMTPKMRKPRRITRAAISPPFQWNVLVIAELVEVADAEVELAVVEVLEALVIVIELDVVVVADAVVVVVVATTPLRSTVKGSSARMVTTQTARSNGSQERVFILFPSSLCAGLVYSFRHDNGKDWTGFP